MKPICVRLQAGWISDRTICYLATGRPAVVQDTGENAVPREAEGLFRFRTVEDARQAIETVGADYSRYSRRARELAKTFFDARKVTATVLERGLG